MISDSEGSLSSLFWLLFFVLFMDGQNCRDRNNFWLLKGTILPSCLILAVRHKRKFQEIHRYVS